MPSKESEAHPALAKAIAASMANIPPSDLQTMRALFDQPQKLASEPTGVTYEDAEVGGVPGLWVHPNDSYKERVILYFHGGGFAFGSPAAERKVVGHLAKAAGTTAFIPDYRLAPEHPFPAQLDDAFAAYKGLLSQGHKPGNIATAGDSAGGNLATTLVLKIIQEKQPVPAAIVAFSPWYDMECLGKTMETNRKTDVMVTKEATKGMVAVFLGGNGSAKDPLANPLYADLKALPPMYINCGTAEALQDDAVRLASKAKEVGVDVTLEETEEMQHVHVLMAGKTVEADSVINNVGNWLKQKLGSS